MEKQDEQLEEKMAEILDLYKQVEITKVLDLSDRAITTISYDEKHRIQTINNIVALLLSVPGEAYPTVQRDLEY